MSALIMSANKEIAFKYDIAEGPNGLRSLLDNYLEKSKSDPLFAEAGHYILYTLGDQRSLIRVDTSSVPFHFRYCDLLGRPATKAVTDTIARFLWDRCGEKERYMKEIAGE